jgi:hypothetical protein
MHESDWRNVLYREFLGDSTPPPKVRIHMFLTSKRAIVNNYVENMDVLIRNAQSSYLAAKASLPSQSNPINAFLVRVYDRAPYNFARNDAGNALWLISLALHAYKLENGAYPTRLKELTPTHLKQIPADPFGAGEPLRYAKRGNSYVLHSIGPDGIDDGGQPVAHRNNVTTSSLRGLPPVLPDSKGDYVAGKNC